MTDPVVHDRQTFEDQGATFLRSNTTGAYTHLIHTKLAELPNVTRLDVYSGD